MRHIAIALVAVILAGFGLVAPANVPAAQAAAPANPKVAIIVGATHSATSRYRSYADELAAEAVKYTNNVVKVYSPNATWSAVKSAVNGASIVIYLGHGNGWPSPYTYDPNYTTKDGFGLNATAGDGDSNTKYYGEPSIRTLTPAPNAVVLLFHLCYASGNSEPGNPEPTPTVARQRVDNYGAGFLAMGARAVIADGHGHSPYYLWALFSTKQSIDGLWRGAPGANGNVQTYPSARTPGMTYQMDPDSPDGGYYRSIVGDMSLSTVSVTGANYADTGSDPSEFMVPGRASVGVDVAPVYKDAAGLAAGTGRIASLPYDTRVRIGSQAGTAPDGSPIFYIRTFDNAFAGYVAGSGLVPRDSAAPKVWNVSDGTGAFSPNDDGSQDTYTARVRLSEDASWVMKIIRGGVTYATANGIGDYATIGWDGLVDGAPAPEGTYRWTLYAADDWQNTPLSTYGEILVDVQAPTLAESAVALATTHTLSPNGDGFADSLALAASMSEPGLVEGAVRNGDGNIVGSISVLAASGKASVTWDGRNQDGSVLPDGTYTLQLAPRDRAGNVGEIQEHAVSLYTALGFVQSSVTAIYPNDGDALATHTNFSFVLASPATVTWTVVDATGMPVRTLRNAAALATGTYTMSWNGKTDAGAYAPSGTYRTLVTATNGTESASQMAAVISNAFNIVISDATPTRGQQVTIVATSTEKLAANPKLYVYQPGIGAWSVSMVKVTGNQYRVTVTIRSSGTGTIKFRALGYDSGSQKQWTYLNLPLN